MTEKISSTSPVKIKNISDAECLIDSEYVVDGEYVINRESWWSGAFASLRGSLQFGDPPAQSEFELIPLADLSKHIPTLIDAARQFYSGDDQRALLSQWSKSYFRVVIAAAGVVALCARRPLRIALSDCVLRTCLGVPESIWITRDAVGARSDNPAYLYRSLCVEHLQPAIEILARAVAMAPRVLWSNAGNIFDQLFDIAAESAELSTNAVGDREWLFGDGEFFDTGFRNPLREPVRYLTPRSALLPNPMRTRRQCCLRNRINGEALCAACPHLHKFDDEQLRSELMRMNLAE